MDRRRFIRNSTIVAGTTILPSGILFARDKGNVKLGYIGVGLRGRNHIKEGLLRDDVEIVAICDTQESSLKLCREQFTKAGKALPKEYTGGLDAYKKLLERKDIDAVIISTPWQFHRDQAVDAMNAGKYVGCEVIAGLTVQDHWDIVNASEKTGIPYMTLENVCYRRDVMAVLNMVRAGEFGELVHLEGGYQHDLRDVLFNDGKNFYGHGVEFGADKSIGEAQWRTQYNIDVDGDLYPTHGLGPVMNYIDINRGNRLTNMVSFSSKARGLADYVNKKSPGHPNAKINYKNGDIVTTLINCANGETISLTHDTHLPRPYSIGFRVQGTNGLWMDVAKSIHIEGKSKPHTWDSTKEWFEKYDHPLWKKYVDLAQGAGHGGMDWFVFNAFVQAVKQKRQTPIDVYDSVTMSVIFPLSVKSLQEGNSSQDIPDFTKGKWKNRKNTFALDDSGF
ncbi:oxidoreductase domain protein [Pseudopedobacter saltans DSM 12145]|uniref:Oxidoreductase domain protein n=1 Tax=Pseudopedobacter saltans (strain ATCC 51119 / DSM 12145 / JCM 21818 / CCUG 39354 / LMG 10337 / NBRC 100064 / NCIMB 13643) TaxID=762903 RepID=F0SE07_PSESL|nr:Gfo/Idh/MocA family oxidoreductase [Pseudopedobacter saltans]ADY52933.1 oxidoreductase domain protein [Pseudopedobacter saltans DSM 12145]